MTLVDLILEKYAKQKETQSDIIILCGIVTHL